MELKCLNCGEPVSEEQARLALQVFVCPYCKELAEGFVNALEADLVMIRGSTGEYLRSMLRRGNFKLPPASAMGRVTALLRWIEDQQCQTTSSSTPAFSPPTHSSGEPSPRHVQTLTAVGRNSSPSSTR